MVDILSSEIFQDFKSEGLLVQHLGVERRITGIAPAELACINDLVFIENEKYLATLPVKGVAAIVTTQEISGLLKIDNTAILVAPNVRMAMAYLRQKYTDRDVYNSEWGRVHETAIIHESVIVPEDVVIGPGVVIGANVQIGSAVVIMANSVDCV